MNYLDILLADRSEIMTVTPYREASDIENLVKAKFTPPIFTVVSNKLFGTIDADILTLKLGLNNLFVFLPTSYCDLSILVKGQPLEVTIEYSEINKHLMKTWFFISHAFVLFWLSYFLFNLVNGQSSVPFTWNEKEGYFLSNYVLLAVSVVIWVCLVFLPVIASKYCWNRTIILVRDFFEVQ